MSAVFSPSGFVPSYHPTGLERGIAYTISASYNTPIYKYGMCTLNTNGTITAAAVAADFLGVFDGVEYLDATGKPVLTNYWPGAVSGATQIVAYVWVDPNIVYTVQADGSIPQTAIGDQADATTATVASGTAATGLSTSSLSASLAGASSQGQWRIVGFDTSPNNAIGDAYTMVQVQIARSQYVSNKVAV